MIDEKILLAHTDPIPRVNEGIALSNLIDRDIAMIDSSDGLADSLWRIANSSKHSILLDYDRVPIQEGTEEFAKNNEINLSNFILWGGEDYELIACVSKETYELLDKTMFKQIGKVLNKDFTPCVFVKSKDFEFKINEKIYEQKAYDHFGSRLGQR